MNYVNDDDMLGMARSGDISGLEGVFAQGVHPNRTYDSLTLLLIAAQAGREDVVKFLISRGADVDKANKNSITPLWVAAREGHQGVAKILLESDCDPSIQAQDPLGTPLDAAEAAGHQEIAYMIRQAGGKHAVPQKPPNVEDTWRNFAESGDEEQRIVGRFVDEFIPPTAKRLRLTPRELASRIDRRNIKITNEINARFIPMNSGESIAVEMNRGLMQYLHQVVKILVSRVAFPLCQYD